MEEDEGKGEEKKVHFDWLPSDCIALAGDDL